MCYVVLANVSVHLKNTNFILLSFYNFYLFPLLTTPESKTVVS